MCREEDELKADPLWEHVTQVALKAVDKGLISYYTRDDKTQQAAEAGENIATFMETVYERLKNAQR